MFPYNFIKLKGCTFYNLCKQHTWMLFICILCEPDWNLISHLANFTAIRKTTFCANKRAIYSQIELVSIETNTLFYPGAMYISDSWPFLWGLWSCRDQSPRASLLPVGEDRAPFVPSFVITRWNKKNNTFPLVNWKIWFLYWPWIFVIALKKDLLRHGIFAQFSF